MSKKNEKKIEIPEGIKIIFDTLDNVCLPLIKGIGQSLTTISNVASELAIHILPYSGMINVTGYVKHITESEKLSEEQVNTLSKSVLYYLSSGDKKKKSAGMKTMVTCPHCQKTFNLASADKKKMLVKPVKK